MEILIGLLVLGFLGLIGFIFKFSTDDAKQQKNIEDAKARRIADLEAEMSRKDVEMKKMMDERQKMEDDFFKAKDEASVFKKDNAELTQKCKLLEKGKDDVTELKNELKQKDTLLQQETVARQKMQGEISLADTEASRANAEVEKLKSDLKAKNDLYEGLKGQFNEVDAELQKVREMSFKKIEIPKPDVAKPDIQQHEILKQEVSHLETPKAEIKKEEVPRVELPKVEVPKVEAIKIEKPLVEPTKPEASVPHKVEPVKAEPAKGLPPKIMPAAHPESQKKDENNAAVQKPEPVVHEVPKSVSVPPDVPEKKNKSLASGVEDVVKADASKNDDIPGFPKHDVPVKMEIKQGVPSDMEFLKAEPARKPEDVKKDDEIKKTEDPEKVVAPEKTEESQKKSDMSKPPEVAAASDIPDGAFKITNVNKPVPPQKPQEKGKSKTKRETLIPGFSPKEHETDKSA